MREKEKENEEGREIDIEKNPAHVFFRRSCTRIYTIHDIRQKCFLLFYTRARVYIFFDIGEHNNSFFSVLSAQKLRFGNAVMTARVYE